MPRTPRLRKKNGFWFTESGCPSGKYFGRIDQMSHKDAKKAFAAHLDAVASRKPVHSGTITAAELFDSFLDAITEHRSHRTYNERKLHLDRFANFRRGAVLVGDLSAVSIVAEDLKLFLDYAHSELKLDPFTVHKHAISIVAAFHWGAGVARLKNPSPCLPSGFRPFANLERYKVPANPLHEDELPTRDEVEAIMKWADTDIANVFENGRYRSRRPKERRTGDDNPYCGFKDLLTVFYSTGARTAELARCNVKDFVPGARQLVLAKHKRSSTLKEATSRRITLNDQAFNIVKALCKGKASIDPIFTDPHGNRWTSSSIDIRFKRVRKLAGVRDEITPYAFRHLYVSEALMSGIDIATISKMVGTSIKMIETTYGHYSGQHFQDAQGKLDAARAARDAKRSAAS
jgi:integrase